MSFTSAKALIRQHTSVIDYDIMLLDLSDVPVVDFSISRALEDIISNTIESGKDFLLVDVNAKVHDF